MLAWNITSKQLMSTLAQSARLQQATESDNKPKQTLAAVFIIVGRGEETSLKNLHKISIPHQWHNKIHLFSSLFVLFLKKNRFPHRLGLVQSCPKFIIHKTYS